MNYPKNALREAVLRQKRPIVVALDSGSWQKDKLWLERLNPKDFWGFKVGSILFTEQGPKVIEEIRKKGFEVFLDLKFHDIPNTVKGAVRSAFQLGVKLVTIHCVGGRAMIEAAVSEEKKDEGQILLGVTVLTSMDEKDLKETGVQARLLKDQVSELAKLAAEAGLSGFVSSSQEVAQLNAQMPNGFFLTPGVRLSGADQSNNKDDQKRIATVEAAFESGSSMVVIGRALTATAENNWEPTWQKIISSTDAKS